MLNYWNKYQHSIWVGILLAIRTFAGFGVQKIVAVFYGPAGTTLFSHFQNLVALFTQPIQDAVTNGLINAFPKKSFKKPQLVGAAIMLVGILVSLTAVFLLIINQFTESIFSFSLDNWLLIVPAILLFCFGLIVSAIYVIQKKLKLYSSIQFIQWLVFFLSLRFFDLQLDQFLMFWLTIQALFSVVLILPVYSHLKVRFKIDQEIVRHFKQFLLMALTIWITSKSVDYFIREYSIEHFGEIQTGLWQSVVRISEAYRGLLISFLFLSLYPTLSKKIAGNELGKGNLKKYFSLYLLFSVSFIFLVFQFNEFILKTLYDIQYVEASKLFQFQIIGDLFAFLAFPFSIYLIASVRTKIYIITEIVSATIFVTVILLKTKVGIEILVYAHIIRFFCYLLLMLFVSRIKNFDNAR